MKFTVFALLMLFAGAIPAQSGPGGSQAPQAETPSANSKQPSITRDGTTSGTVKGNMEVLTDTQGVDLGPYLSKVLQSVRENWYQLIPTEAHLPELKKGAVSIEFVILRNGQVDGMKIVGPSGDAELDKAAWGGIEYSVPFAALPDKFHGPYLALRIHFYYNPSKNPSDASQPEPKPPQ